MPFADGFEPEDHGPANAHEAARLLTQATFGPTLGEIARLQQIGSVVWLEQQFAQLNREGLHARGDACAVH